MKLIVCLDENNGMTFNNRRQSKDRVVGERIKEIAGPDKKIYISPKSEKLAAEYGLNYIADDHYLGKAGKDDYCFCEFELPDESMVTMVIIFRWGRRYPKSSSFTYDLGKWKKIDEIKFKGTSHNEITQEIYIR